MHDHIVLLSLMVLHKYFIETWLPFQLVVLSMRHVVTGSLSLLKTQDVLLHTSTMMFPGDGTLVFVLFCCNAHVSGVYSL